MTNFYSEPITTLEEGKTYLNALHKAGLMYHLEDDATDIVWSDSNVTTEMAEAFDDRSEELYELNWCEHECPLGYAMHLEGL